VLADVKDLVAGAGFGFTDRGTHRLKGVPDSWQLYAVELAELFLLASKKHRQGPSQDQRQGNRPS
jgi:hypothetical protein